MGSATYQTEFYTAYSFPTILREYAGGVGTPLALTAGSIVWNTVVTKSKCAPIVQIQLQCQRFGFTAGANLPCIAIPDEINIGVAPIPYREYDFAVGYFSLTGLTANTYIPGNVSYYQFGLAGQQQYLELDFLSLGAWAMNEEYQLVTVLTLPLNVSTPATPS